MYFRQKVLGRLHSGMFIMWRKTSFDYLRSRGEVMNNEDAGYDATIDHNKYTFKLELIK